MAKIKSLRGKLSKDHEVFKLTEEELVLSSAICGFILDFDITLFKTDPNPVGSFQREGMTKLQEETAVAQSARQSSMYKVLKHQKDEIEPHNLQMMQEYREEEKGLEDKSSEINIPALKSQIKDELLILSKTEPERAQ